MVLMKEYKKSKDDDYENMSVVTGSMRLVLKALKNGLIPHEQYTEQELISFSKSLINCQESNGSWQVYKPEFSISEEDMVDFVFFPTQIACSILSHVKQNHSVSELTGIDEAVSRGLKFSVSNKLEGFGYNMQFQKLESLIIFTEGSVIELLNQDPRICPSCYDRLIELKEEIQNLVEKGDTTMEYGGDYREQYEFVLKGLEGI
jgi:hypothetical protein